MVRRRMWPGAIALLGLMAPLSGSAGTITFTGDVEKDFPLVKGNDIRVLVDNPFPTPADGSIPQSNPRDVDVPAWMRAENKEAGWNFKDIRLYYDQASDSLAVGINFFGVGGDVDGDGNPDASDPRTTASGGLDEARFGGGETVSVAFDVNNDRKADFIVGIPVNKPAGQDGLASFTIAKYKDNPGGLAFGYGDSTVGSTSLLSFLGNKAIETSLSKPDMEFQLKNFSALGKLFNSSFDPAENGLGIQAFAAGMNDVIVGEDSIAYQFISPQVITPEPATILAWSAVLAGGAAWRFRRRARQRA
jgi:hypothetical protein